jgi:hypothetical protein
MISKYVLSPSVVGLVVTVLATRPRFAGSNPAADDGFKGDKIRSTPSAVGPTS